MRVQRITSTLLLLLGVTSMAFADDKQPAPPAPAAAPAQPPKAKPLSPEELATQGQIVVRRGTVVSQNVRNMLEEARKEADIIKITCLDDKLTQINVNLRTAETRFEAMRKAVDPDRRMHEYTVITVLGQKLQVLDQEAHQCVGQAMYETGATKVVTEIDKNMLPSEDAPASNPPVILPPTLITIPEAGTDMM